VNVAKSLPREGGVEWRAGEHYPRISFFATDTSRPEENAVAFCNRPGTCEQWIKDGKGAGAILVMAWFVLGKPGHDDCLVARNRPGYGLVADDARGKLCAKVSATRAMSRSR